jgi:hypothetical protein
MNGRQRLILGATAAGLMAFLVIAAWSYSAGRGLPAEYATIQRFPRIQPDYGGAVIPPNIAPLNFSVAEPGVEYRVRIHGEKGDGIDIASREPSIVIPLQSWRELLSQNRGGRIIFDIYARSDDGRWSRFDSIKCDIAQEEIDSHLVYRLLGPVCNLYHEMGIYQRNLENYDESPIITNESFAGCVNCHSFANNRSDTFCFHIRPGDDKKIAAGMIVAHDGQAFRMKTHTKATSRPPGYTSWHPNSPVAAFAMIRPGQCFRGAGDEIREVFDYESDLAAVNVETGALSTSPGIADGGKLETFPGWSADGKVLYFVSSDPLGGRSKRPTADDTKRLMYDLMRVRYDIERSTWSEPELVLSSVDTGKSISEPRASPDGRYLLFCMSNYGGFPVVQPSSDLYLLDLKSGKHRRLECNSEQSESWHCWSSNSRWIVFSSKRDNGLLARPHFSYLDRNGLAHKPFVLPQKDPKFYDTWMRTYNVPELISGPVAVSQERLLRAIRAGNAATKAPPGVDAPARANGDPYQND